MIATVLAVILYHPGLEFTTFGNNCKWIIVLCLCYYLHFIFCLSISIDMKKPWFNLFYQIYYLKNKLFSQTNQLYHKIKNYLLIETVCHLLMSMLVCCKMCPFWQTAYDILAQNYRFNFWSKALINKLMPTL